MLTTLGKFLREYLLQILVTATVVGSQVPNLL